MWLRRKFGHMIINKNQKNRVYFFKPSSLYDIVTAKPLSRLENSRALKYREGIFLLYEMSKQTKVRYMFINICTRCFKKTNATRLTFLSKQLFWKTKVK